MERKARVAVQPSADFRVFVGGVIVENDVNGFVFWHAGVDFIEKPDELLVAMLLHILPDHGAIKHIEGCKQCCRASWCQAAPF